ncbi:Metallo-dependent phosphatase-like protein [Hyaloscypha variabilis]
MSEVKKSPRSQRKGILFTSASTQKHDLNKPISQDTSTPTHTLQPPGESTIITKILILSDTHGHDSLPSRLPSSPNLDLAIHCGDLSQHGSLSDYHATLALLSSLPAPLKLVIPGNHDLSLGPSFTTSNNNFTLTERQELHTQALNLWTGAEAKAAGIVFLEPGFHEFVLGNGARLRVYATPFTPYPAGVDASEWAFGYASSRDMYNPAGAGIWYSVEGGREEMLIADERRSEVDVLVSHGPPRYRLDLTERGENVGSEVHAFGHVHAGYGAERVVWKEDGGKLPRDDDVEDGIARVWKEKGVVREGGVRFLEVRKDKREDTTFINAALMGEDSLERMPCVLEIELASAEAKVP